MQERCTLLYCTLGFAAVATSVAERGAGVRRGHISLFLSLRVSFISPDPNSVHGRWRCEESRSRAITVHQLNPRSESKRAARGSMSKSDGLSRWFSCHLENREAVQPFGTVTEHPSKLFFTPSNIFTIIN